MQEEIKEILDGLKKISTPTGISYSGDVTINNDDVKILKDYITNLQEENERLNMVVTIQEDYKSRNEKAIDKIYCYGEVFDREILQQFQKEMLDTLQGVDKE